MMTFSRRRFLRSAATFGAAAAGLLAPRFARAKDLTVTIGFWNSPHPDHYAKGTGGYDRALGTRVKTRFVQLQSGAQAVNLFASGDLDLAFCGSSPAVAGFAKAVPMSMIYIASVVTRVEALVVKGIDSIEQLRGRKIATPFNSSAHFALLAALEKAKLSPAALSVLNMPPPQILAAWQRGDIDGAYIWMPIQTEMTQSGGKVIFTSEDLAPLGRAIFNGYLVRDAFKKEHPDLVLAYLQELNRAISVLQEKPNEYVKDMSRIMSIDTDKVRAYTAALTLLSPQEQASQKWMGAPGAVQTGVIESLMQQAVFLKAQGSIDTVPKTFAPFVDASFLAKLV